MAVDFVRFTMGIEHWSASLQLDCWCLSSMSFSIVLWVRAFVLFYFISFHWRTAQYFKPHIVSTVHIINNCCEWLSFKPALAALSATYVRFHHKCWLVLLFKWPKIRQFPNRESYRLEMQKHVLLTFPMQNNERTLNASIKMNYREFEPIVLKSSCNFVNKIEIAIAYRLWSALMDIWHQVIHLKITSAHNINSNILWNFKSNIYEHSRTHFEHFE